MILAYSQKSLEKIIEKLSTKCPVVIPTETVYGLAARIDQPEAINKIFSLKKRPFFDPLIVHIHSSEQLRQLTSFRSPLVDSLAKAFWPGPLTLVLPKLDSLNPTITSGLDSVGIRMPSHPMALEVLELCDVPLAAPSANLFGRTSPTKAQHVEDDFSDPSLLILDGGDCEIGIESTVLKISQNKSSKGLELAILRKGVVTKSQILEVLRSYRSDFIFIKNDDLDKRSSPGHLKHHYMPNKPLVFLNHDLFPDSELILRVNEDLKKIPDYVEGVKITKPNTIHGLKSFTSLEFDTDPLLATRQLYDTLKTKSQNETDFLVFKKSKFMHGELWEGFLERLEKASSLKYI